MQKVRPFPMTLGTNRWLQPTTEWRKHVGAVWCRHLKTVAVIPAMTCTLQAALQAAPRDRIPRFQLCQGAAALDP